MLMVTQHAGFGGANFACASPTLISGATGSNIGDMTSRGGLAAAFDGTTSQAGTASASIASQTSAWIGKNYSGGAKRIVQAKLWSPNASVVGFVDNFSGNVTISVQYSHTGSWGGEEVEVASETFADLTSQPDSRTVAFTSQLVKAQYWRVKFTPASGTNEIFCAECQFYECV